MPKTQGFVTVDGGRIWYRMLGQATFRSCCYMAALAEVTVTWNFSRDSPRIGRLSSTINLDVAGRHSRMICHSGEWSDSSLKSSRCVVLSDCRRCICSVIRLSHSTKLKLSPEQVEAAHKSRRQSLH
jgi:hypothetical protein